MDIEKYNQKFTTQEKLQVLNKIEDLKLEVSECDLKKSGRNTFQKYSYFELKDFMPTVRMLCKKHGLATQFNIVGDNAYLHVYDLETGCFRRWTHELPEPDNTTTNKQGQTIIVKDTEKEKVKGALETYARRYLYLAFLELTDGDAIDSGDVSQQKQQKKEQTKSKSSKPTNKKYPTPKQVIDQIREELGDAYNKETATKLLEKYVRDDITTPAIQKLVQDLIERG